MALLVVRDLVKEFPRRLGVTGGSGRVRAVDGVSFEVNEGEVFGLVGESGSGKTTIGRCILRLVEPTSGHVFFKGTDLGSLDAAALRALRREMQMVFQDPYSSLTPHLSAGSLVEEPLVIHRLGTRAERRERVAELLRLVGLDPADARKRPAEFSGGQRQRLGLARALALNPSLVVADEPVSALDVRVQAQVIALLQELQAKLRLTYVLIAHDLRLVERLCSRVGVMYQGRLVELCDTAELFEAPAHPYTRALLSAIPVADPSVRPTRGEWDGRDAGPDAPFSEISRGHWVRGTDGTQAAGYR